ncbi:hypothetical protein AC249_AIPGENE17395 [Exaiptasia diaphana]|nr:hypothetical protein AC249_AIPGENE17395 [Exaiptasia diaphana]
MDLAENDDRRGNLRDQHLQSHDEELDTVSINASAEYQPAQDSFADQGPLCSRLLGVTQGNLVYFIIVLSLGGVLSLSVTIQKPPGLIKTYINWFFICCMGIAILWMLGVFVSRNLLGGCCLTAREEGTKIPCYMIIGLTIFCLGSCFIAGVDFIAFLYTLTCKELEHDSSEGVFNVVKILFLIFQLHFFCRLSDVNFYRQWCTSFFILHIIAVNLSTWFYYIVDESVDEPKAGNFTNCKKLNDMNKFVTSADAYLYTFNIEYTVMSSVLLLLMWFELRKDAVQSGRRQNLDNSCCSFYGCWERLKDIMKQLFQFKPPSNGLTNSESDQMTMIFWKPAVCGYTFGALVFVFYLVLIVLSAIEYPHKYYFVFRIVLFIFMLMSSILGLVYLPRSYSSQSKIHTRVDSILIMIGVTGCYVMVIFEVISAIYDINSSSECQLHGNETTPNTTSLSISLPSFCPVMKIFVADNIVVLLQFSFQAIFIVKALGRRQEDVSLAAPTALAMVRNMSALLSLGNFGIWVMDTFELKDIKTQGAIEIAAYGLSTWKILSHIAYPLCIFFRLHSAFCFFEIAINRFGVTVHKKNGYSAI